jgi:hypothetical protein
MFGRLGTVTWVRVTYSNGGDLSTGRRRPTVRFQINRRAPLAERAPSDVLSGFVDSRPTRDADESAAAGGLDRGRGRPAA